MIKVLIVEDDPMVALINRKYLEEIGNVEIVDTVMYEEEVLKVLNSKNVDLILLDVYLPGKSGIEILSDLRKQNYYQDVIMITAANSSEEIDKVFAYGVVDYLIKPFDFNRFKEAINKFNHKKSIIENNDKITQDDLDRMLKSTEEKEKITLPKGLNKRTFDKVIEYLSMNSNEDFTLREIARELKISNVTIKKYMDYLESIDKVVVEIEYGNIGRPELKYHYKNL
ncbi:MAG: response regulator [Clostridium sp.]|nr:response regulator [Clostridium sp.]